MIWVGEVNLELSAGCNVANASLNVERGRPSTSLAWKRVCTRVLVRRGTFDPKRGCDPPRSLRHWERTGAAYPFRIRLEKNSRRGENHHIGSSWVYQYRVETVHYLNRSPTIFCILLLSAIVKLVSKHETR